eukprot:TRINITY_DN13665_c0_g1_i1.p1 TRINITY_DN13665_c0_g1~~TRINITY_DN13665_c0_g1_i1.p1  ORF type:complete len:651 (+),score=247.71 TRINITY_DN13665_c0_g1_i1:300-2252(+)
MAEGDNDTCLELALEGEKLCKAGKCRDGVAFFEAALQSGTDDFRTLSAIYSQLGNAYFYLGDYVKAMQYHKHDLTLARTMGDRLGEAKASGNLGNTLKVMGKFEEAVICCRRHLEICREHKDRVGEGRALYNLGNVYHAKGKHIGRLGHQDPGEFPEEVKALFEKAVEYYEENMVLMVEIQDRAAQGRACGNLGNVHYLLGDFNKAIHYHEERLKIAKEFGDRSAERRAHSNLGNAHIFLGEFEQAAEHYKMTLLLAQELGDRAVEAQACYSLGNTYTLLKDYPTAVEYHLRHLRIAQELFDKVGEGRACWSLGNAHSAMGETEAAYHYASRHLEIAKETGDRMGQATAQVNLSELAKTLGYTEGVLPPGKVMESPESRAKRRMSMENMQVIKMTPDVKSSGRNHENGVDAGQLSPDQGNKSDLLDDEEDFFDFISRFQSKRMDDQRCSLADPLAGDPEPLLPQAAENGKYRQPEAAAATNGAAGKPGVQVAAKEELLDMIAGAQASRLNEQRAPWSVLPGLTRSKQPEILQRLSVATTDKDSLPDDSFFEQLMKMQGTRIEDQRSSLPGEEGSEGGGGQNLGMGPPQPVAAPTMPDEDFFSLICRIQGGRIDDQRAYLPGGGNWPDRGGLPSNGVANGTGGGDSKTSDI